MAEDERTHDNAAGAEATGPGGGNVEGEGNVEAAGNDPASLDAEGGVRDSGGEGGGGEGGSRAGDWDPGQVSGGGGELY